MHTAQISLPLSNVRILSEIMMDIVRLICKFTDKRKYCPSQSTGSSFRLTLWKFEQLNCVVTCHPAGCFSGLNICKSAWEQSAFTFQSEEDSISRSIKTVADQQEE